MILAVLSQELDRYQSAQCHMQHTNCEFESSRLRMYVAGAALLTEVILNFFRFLPASALTEGHEDDLLSCRYRLTPCNHPAISHRLLFLESESNQFCA